MSRTSTRRRNMKLVFALGLAITIALPLISAASQPVSPEDILSIKTAASAEVSPDGRWVAYTVRVPRAADDKPGGDYQELWLASVATGDVRPFVTGKTSAGSPQWRPDGSSIAFLTKRGEKGKTQVWIIPTDGGEARQATRSETDVIAYRWHPDGKHIAYIAATPKTKRETALGDKGYDFVYVEEALKHRNLYLDSAAENDGSSPPRRLTDGITVWDFEFDHQGKRIAFAGSERNLVDSAYMFKKIYVLDLESGKFDRVSSNEGKLGNFAFSPDGSKIAYAAALERWDHAVSQAYVIDAGGGEALNLTPPGFNGHIQWVGWKDAGSVVYLAGEGVWNTFSVVSARGGERKVILHSKDSGVIFDGPSFTRKFEHFAFVGTAPDVPSDVYYWRPGKALKRITTLNPWLSERALAKQEVIRYAARDGREIEGILYYPLDYSEGQSYPLVVNVHGGPESHYSNDWHSRYFQPPQVLAGRGYFVFLPNYRSSTGYGVEVIRTDHLGDPAGKEFDDIADGIDHLVESGLVDKDRVGLGGGSYGGYAAAWFSSYYTEKVKAVCMLVGISDLVSKRGSTDIPYEELYVHSQKKLEDMWELSLQRSPIYHAGKSKTAVLILGGKDDTRVHPSQSLEYYTRLKMNDHPAVRFVQYPGEGHGNRRQPGRADVLYRTLEWLDWYVKDGKPLDGPMPPLDLSGSYSLELPKD